MSNSTSFLTPSGRLVMGDCFEGQTKDAEGNPLVIKNGPNAGQPRVDYFLGIAVPKGAETHWNQTEWGALIYAEAKVSFPQLFDAQGTCIAPAFAFKVTDGDSQLPNTKGTKPCDRAGFPGNWIINLSGGFAPKCYTKGGAEVVPDATHPSAIKRGFYCRIYGSVKGNGSMQQPGVYLNHSMVEFIGYGEEIVSGPSGDAVFGAAPAAMPVGASAAPIAPVTTIAQPGVAVAPVAAPVAVAPVAAPVAVAPVVGVVQPANDFLTPPVATAPVVRTYNVQGTEYTAEQLKASGWNDAQIAQLG